MILYAASTNGFYDSTIHATYPPDAIEISIELRDALIQAQAIGGKIQPGQDGLPTASMPTVAEKRAVQWEAIKAERDRRKAAGVKVGDNWFHSDDGSRIQWIGLKDQARDVLAAGGTTSTVLQRLGRNIMWKTMSGAFVPATVGLAFAVVEAVGDLDAAAFGAAEQHRAAMEASADPAAYDLSTGWPLVYGE